MAVRHARHRVRDWMAGAGWPARATNDVLLVISELVTNGIIHDGAKDIEVSVALDELGGASVEVVTADLPSGHTSPDVRAVSDPVERGRGLALVDALSDALSIEDRGGRRRTACHLSLRY
jgi:anti-sigma regulatory factor (Ser/Thr protein kinase)